MSCAFALTSSLRQLVEFRHDCRNAYPFFNLLSFVRLLQCVSVLASSSVALVFCSSSSVECFLRLNRGPREGVPDRKVGGMTTALSTPKCFAAFFLLLLALILLPGIVPVCWP